jgi:hypothetical protein
LHIEKSGHFTVDVVLNYFFMKAGKYSVDVSNRLDPLVPMKVTVNEYTKVLGQYTLALCSGSVESLGCWNHWRSPKAGYHNSILVVELVYIG